MAEALENAYLVLLGQIALVLSAIVFGVPFFFAGSGPPHFYQPTTILFLVFASAASVMMVANIIIGWAALRGSMENKEHYTIRMFIVDILIVLTFFFMNNAILFSFGGTLSLDKVSNLKTLLDQGVPLRTVSFLAASLYFLTAIFLLLCKAWNRLYCQASGKPPGKRYEQWLWVIIAAAAASGIVALFKADSFITQAILLPIWLFGWIYINGHWLVLDFFGPTRIAPSPAPTPPSTPNQPTPSANSGAPVAVSPTAAGHVPVASTPKRKTRNPATPKPPRTK